MGKGNIVLIGFMGCGKTTVGKALSKEIGKPVLDTDVWIERKQQKTITEIFREDGEDAFREMETDCLKQLLSLEEKHIISVGGGLPQKKENRKILHSLGTVVYLKIAPEEVFLRLQEDTDRPLLQVENPIVRIRELLTRREPLYMACADIVIDVTQKTIEEIVQEILSRQSEQEEGI